ncbi:MAG: hypothetical protein WCJ74_00290 [bacterium]
MKTKVKMSLESKAAFAKAAAILAKNRKDTAPYAGRLPEEGDSPRKKEAIKKLLKEEDK